MAGVIDMELTNNARIGVVGGGPAGAFTAFFLLDFAERIGLENLQVDIYEPMDFSFTGAKGCNHCGGLISESMLQHLSLEGIVIPSEVIMNTVDSYKMHTQDGSVVIRLPLAQMRIATVYRGSGPQQKGVTETLFPSFDGYLLSRACERGAKHIMERVMKLTWADGLPQVHTKSGMTQTYDLLVGAVGVNGAGVRLFKGLNFDYTPPKMVKAYVGEYHIGEAHVKRYIGDAMNVFLLDIPGLKFAALIPKGPFVTLCMQGDVNGELVEEFLRHPVVRHCFPPDWVPPAQGCYCLPKCNVGEPLHYYSDRVVLVGDCGVSRLYKDGIGAAYQTARACAATAVFYGIRKQDFQAHYQPLCQRMKWDNQLGHFVFSMIELPKKIDFLRRGIITMTRREQNLGAARRPMSMFLWNSFTGSAMYKQILWESMHPRFTLRFFWELLRALFGGKKVLGTES